MSIMTTPAGETIEVVSDEDFMEVYDVNPVDLRIWSPKMPIFAALWHEGAVISQSGRATTQLHLTARRYGYTADMSALNGVFRGGVAMGAIERKVNGRRTNEIRLVRLPKSYVEKLKQVKSKVIVTKLPPTKAAATGEGDLVPNIEDYSSHERQHRIELHRQPDPPLIEEAKASVALDDETQVIPDVADAAAQQVARHLLAEVVKILTAPPPEPVVDRQMEADFKEARERLAKSLEYSQQLRKQLGDVEFKLREVISQRDQLQRLLGVTEAKLQQNLGSQGNAMIREELAKALDGLMRQRPSTKGE